METASTLGPLLLLVLLSFLPPAWVWKLRAPFVFTNWLQWYLTSPLRMIFKENDSRAPRTVFFALSPLGLVYAALAYIVLLPVRLINALYYDVLLFLSVSMRNGLADLIWPDYYFYERWKIVAKWILMFPVRLVIFLGKHIWFIFQGILMVLFDLVWPTLTLYHGTEGTVAKTVAHSGQWLVGWGDYAGTGIYFGLTQHVAEHYSRTKGWPEIIVARVTLAPCRPISTLPEDLRHRIGHWQGDSISQGVKFPWASLEHWRSDNGWYEFCLTQPSKGRMVLPWRVRPICVLVNDKPERIQGGLALWPRTRRGWIVMAITLLILLLAATGVAEAGAEATWAVVRGLARPPDITLPRLSLPKVHLPKIDLPDLTLRVPDFSAKGEPLIKVTLPSFEPPALAVSSCPGAPPLRLRTGQRGCVAELHGQTLRVRSEPELDDQNIVARSRTGADFDVLDGPVCSQNYAWWRIRLRNGVEGWAAEGNSSNYYLEPCS